MVPVSKKKSTTSHKLCSVPQCSSKSRSEISLHYFPKDERLKALWAIAVRIGKPITKYMYVCSLHFLKEDYILPDSSKRRILKRYAVPSQNLPVADNDSLPKAELEKSKNLRAEWAKYLNEFRRFSEDGLSILHTCNPVVIYIKPGINT